ncbi:MAG: endo-1,4-beta-xylanase, partial [Actinomycetota bacterium]|nr:endo-1,4-beta-xylanase [Actinomycetota bacterium]
MRGTDAPGRRVAAVLSGLLALLPHVVFGIRHAGAVPCSTTGFSPGSGITWESDVDLARDLDQIAATGAQWLRIDVPWSVVEPQRGAFNFYDIDRMVNASRARNLKLIGILHLTPQWARAPGSDSDLWPPVNASEYANYVKATVQRYSSKVKVWEIWNEPNITVFWHPKPDP